MFKSNYCCERFADAAREREIIPASEKDETAWFINRLWHIYYCPFCGESVKGKGWGQFNKKKQKPKVGLKRNTKTKGIVHKTTC